MKDSISSRAAKLFAQGKSLDEVYELTRLDKEVLRAIQRVVCSPDYPEF